MYDIHLYPEKLSKMNQNVKKPGLSPGENPDEKNTDLNEIFLKFCMTDEVNKKRQIFCLFKATF